jgi:hypothetical protein
MRNTIDKEAYKLLFAILAFFIGTLTLITSLLFVDLKGFSPITFKVSGILLLSMLGLTMWLRSEYLKMYNTNSYQTQKISLWAGAAVSFLSAVAFSII